MKPSDADPVTAAQRAIARYLRDNPLASDTAEGIHRWWLCDTQFTPATVQQALDELGQQGVLARQPAADGHQRYRLAMPASALDAFMSSMGGGADGTCA